MTKIIKKFVLLRLFIIKKKIFEIAPKAKYFNKKNFLKLKNLIKKLLKVLRKKIYKHI